jgi:hypothetical protein
VEDFIEIDAARPLDGVSVTVEIVSEVAASPTGVVEASSACPSSWESKSELA